jgi:hypothetical protein
MAHPHHHHDYSARAHPEYVALDIGDDIGALIVHTPPEMHGVEIEISRDGEARTGSHKQVLERRAGDRAAYTAVFDQLSEGSYTLWTGDVARVRGVKVGGGGIAELRWPADEI